MELKFAKKIVKTGNEMDMELTLSKNYSGRGMYGRETAGVVGNLGEIVQAIAAVAVEYAENAEFDETINVDSFIKDMNISIDSMGRDTIVY
jgi:hypothetical protein